MNLLDSWFKLNVGDAAFYAVFGLIFVVFGIVLLVLIFTALGAVMKRLKERKNAAVAPVPPSPRPVPDQDEITPEVLAAITAAITAYMGEQESKCEFVVRRIKKI